MKALGVILAATAVGGGGWLGYVSFFGGNSADAYVLQKVDRGDVVKTISATGTIEPLVKLVVGSQVSGDIKNWYADFNDKVTKGFVLAELDPDRFQTAFDQAKASLSLANSREVELGVRFRDAERERLRLEKLQETFSASENEYLGSKAEADAAQAAWDGAKAGVELADAAMKAAQVDLQRTIIRSPIDGVVISRDIDVGQTVAASLQAPTLFTIANDLERMEVHANVSEADIGLIREGMQARFTVDAYPGRDFEGAIAQIRFNPTIVDSVVTYITLISVSNPDLSLRPGMTANVTFEVSKVSDVIRIPNAALRFNPNPPGRGERAEYKRTKGPTVYKLAGGKPVAAPVKIGLTDAKYSELLEGGLSEGDEIITERNWAGTGRGTRDPTRSMRR
ncbi:MAG: efflux RND transporter periplasmic adaptor subunit [Planctomycetota bacterium]|nr:efflux RND transporter periplasmic adaptor subunit [Planctomycetota bacterium]